MRCWDSVKIEVIGMVSSPITEGVDENWGNVVSEIRLNEKYVSGLMGLEEFSHVLVLFYMHKYSFDPEADLVRRPQGRPDMPPTGIFAQRAKHRPNPIGVTVVKLLSVKGDSLVVKGLDAINGTPVIDVKPYFPSFDSRSEAETPPWVDKLMKGYF
jgi:tRNA-Thr(GGU) m(6)t(6)A37 methyltransferase TsaA